MECVKGPSGGSPPAVHLITSALSLKPFTGSHLSPPSVVRNRPNGTVPAYQVPGCDACPGVSQNTALTAFFFFGSLLLGNAGGLLASFHVLPPSVERNTVGPMCPVREPISSVLPSRGSRTRWSITEPSMIGPSIFQPLRFLPPRRMNAPFMVPTRSETAAALDFDFDGGMVGFSHGNRSSHHAMEVYWVEEKVEVSTSASSRRRSAS